MYESAARRCFDLVAEVEIEGGAPTPLEAKDLATAGAVATDKLLLLRKQATSISERRGAGDGPSIYQQISQQARTNVFQEFNEGRGEVAEDYAESWKRTASTSDAAGFLSQLAPA